MKNLWRWIGFGIDLAALALEEFRKRKKPAERDAQKRKDELEEAARRRKEELRG